MNKIISILIWIAGTFLTMMLFFADLFFTIILFPFDKKRKVVHAQCFWWSDALIGLNPYWNITVIGRENIDPKKTYVIVSNHESLADIVVMYQTRMQFKWVAKESLYRLPFLGGALFLGKHIKISRGKMSSIKNVYKETIEWLRKDMSVAFFPEGTRTGTGKIENFKNGAFKIAIREKRPVLPISIKGTGEAIPKGSWIFKTKVSGTVKIFPAIDTDCYKAGDFVKLRDVVKEQLINA